MKKKTTFWFPTWSDTNQAVQKIARDLKFRIHKVENCTISVAKTIALICVFVFAYAKCWFSHDAAHMLTSSPPLARFFGSDVIARKPTLQPEGGYGPSLNTF